MEVIEHATTWQLMEFWRHFRAGWKARGANNMVELSDPEFFFCVVVAAQKADFVTKGKVKEDDLKKMSLAEMQEIAEPLWNIYQESSKPIDDDEKKV